MAKLPKLQTQSTKSKAQNKLQVQITKIQTDTFGTFVFFRQRRTRFGRGISFASWRIVLDPPHRWTAEEACLEYDTINYIWMIRILKDDLFS